MESKVKVEKVTIKIGENTTELTLDEVRALRATLNDLLGEQKAVPYYIPYPAYPTYYPPYVITCTSCGTDNLTLNQ